MFHECPGCRAVVLSGDLNVALTLLAGSPPIDASPPALTTTPPRLGGDREREPPNKAWAPSDTCCLRCGGLLAPGYPSSLEHTVTGNPVTLWRCVNCGDCVDRFILANRWKGPGPAGPRIGLRPGHNAPGGRPEWDEHDSVTCS
jgi:hypothetical protein